MRDDREIADVLGRNRRHAAEIAPPRPPSKG
jgi:hypothetical protein